MTATTADLHAVALVCTLTPSPAPSSSDLIARQLLTALAEHGVAGSTVRVVDHDVKPGVQLDMGNGDAWPAIRAQVLTADIVIVSTPTWMGQHSSVAQRVLERLDAELSETDDEGRLQTFGKVETRATTRTSRRRRTAWPARRRLLRPTRHTSRGCSRAATTRRVEHPRSRYGRDSLNQQATVASPLRCGPVRGVARAAC